MYMLNISFLACTNVELLDLTVIYCGKWEKISESNSDLDLDPTMSNIELVHDIFIYMYYNVLKFHVPRSFSF